ncbi:alkaline phosphatase family protein [Bacillus sp. BRMEA1]|uniref:phospholipase C n=1 Tax=Neobacillus endophyticus TaxID=2738405 RepID=UPI00156659A3|nr:alkaline phosphatase family protein [Neobacillus endophyticus]NRD77803.1 alkaline phosphatase family protein [Neobacillus endophyticus]
MKGKNLAKIVNVLSAAALGTMLSVSSGVHAQVKDQKKSETSTPIKHVVVIFGENVSFDHYFGTYPYALNVKGEPKFFAKANTPEVNNLLTPQDYNGTQPNISKTNLITNNPNSANTVRLDRSQAMTADMDHSYHDEMAAVDGGKMDKFVETVGEGDNPKVVMDYYDGNTVTALWNYAQNFAMSDNSYGTVFGPSTPGALNLISGETHNATLYDKNGKPVSGNILNEFENGTITGDPNPHLDKASTGVTAQMDDNNKNVGDLLNAKGITWGWFQGGFADPTHKSTNIGGAQVTDYSPHHQPFEYYKSTANPDHLPPSSPNMIGKTDQANHQYDMKDFWAAVDNGNMPSVSYLKAPMYQDGHAGYSDPLDEQQFIVNTINHLEKTPEWKDTAVMIAYDDSDGWYDHALAPSNGQSVESGKAGYGPRLPLLVISPYAKSNYVDHTLTDQSSILKFIEDNWNLGRIGGDSFDVKAGSLNNMFDFKKGLSTKKLFLDEKTGKPLKISENKWTYEQAVQGEVK